MDFTPSDPLSIGLELELQLLNKETLNLADGILPLIDFYPHSPYVKPEFIQNTVEVASKVCMNLPDLRLHIATLVSDLRDKCDQLGMTLCGAGSHPFCERLALITPLPRYLAMEASSGHLGHVQITFATHVHVGMTSGDEAIAMMRELKAFLPMLIALSANSPYWRGYDTGYVCYRHRILAASRSYGIPPSFENWGKFSDFFNTARQAGIFETINNIHWDIRPRPHLGTLELRVMDAQSTIGTAMALASLVRALVWHLRNRNSTSPEPQIPRPLPWWLEKENHFQAARLGLEAKFIEDERGTVSRLGDVTRRVLDLIRPTAEELGDAPYFDRLRDTIDQRTNYARQKQIYENTGSLKKVVAALVEDLHQDSSSP